MDSKRIKESALTKFRRAKQQVKEEYAARKHGGAAVDRTAELSEQVATLDGRIAATKEAISRHAALARRARGAGGTACRAARRVRAEC